MSATIVWSVDSMPYNTQAVNGFNQVVATVNWRCSGYETVGSIPYTYSMVGSCPVPEPVSGDATFTEYNNLKPEQVIAWCWANGVDQQAVESTINAVIANQINSPIAQAPLPWTTT
jgi:hypothetical protein